MGLFYRVDTDFKIIKASLTQIFSDTRFQGALFHKTIILLLLPFHNEIYKIKYKPFETTEIIAINFCDLFV